MRRLASIAVALFLAGFGLFLWISAPAVQEAVPQADAARLDLANGERVFWAGGCASCHAAKDAKGDDKRLLGGGHRLNTPFGTFVTPNISPDAATGIGTWTLTQFTGAMRLGVSPSGEHYYPSFPYTSYIGMTDGDLADLFAFIKTLPEVPRANEPHELALPFRWRRVLGVWKQMFVSEEWKLDIDDGDPVLERGRYLVETLGHCGECHTPRNLLGGPSVSRWLAGGPSPEGEGRIPNITPHPDTLGGWSATDIAYYLESGFTPDFDFVGGSMVSVQANMAKLPKEDLEAIAAYLKAVPPLPRQ